MVLIVAAKQNIKKVLFRIGYRNTPNFLIIGAQKAGTTALYSYLIQHPQIAEPIFKEAHFFDWDVNYEQGTHKYYANFLLPYQVKRGQKLFEATPDYLFFPWCAERIFRFDPSLRLIVVLRDPIERAYSAWNMHHFKFKDHKKYYWLYDPRTFESAIEEEIRGIPQDLNKSYLARGLYLEQIQRYLTYFSKEQILILESNNLERDPESSLEKVARFLEISSFSAEEYQKNLKWSNKSDYQDGFNFELFKTMSDFFEKPNFELKDFLGYNTYWMRK